MRENEGGRPYMADAHAAVRARAARSGGRGRDRPIGRSPVVATRSDERTRSPSDPMDTPAATWNGTSLAVRATGRTAGMPLDSLDGTDRSDSATSDAAVIVRPRRPRKNPTV